MCYVKIIKLNVLSVKDAPKYQLVTRVGLFSALQVTTRDTWTQHMQDFGVKGITLGRRLTLIYSQYYEVKSEALYAWEVI